MKQVARFEIKSPLAVLVVLLLLVPAAWGQRVTGSIIGTVTDPSGAVVPDASVAARNVATNLSRSATTDAAGFYRIDLLPIGTYSLTIEATGFRREILTDISLQIDQVARIDVALQVGELEQEVRQNSDFFLIARTDALSGCGYEEAVRRGQLYAEAGADAVFIEAPRELEQVREIPQRVPAPCVAIVVEGGKSPLLDAAELAEMGYRIIFFPATAIVSATTAMLSALKELRETGSVKKLADRVVGFRTIQELVGLEEQQNFETKFQGSSEETKQASSNKGRR